MTRYSRAMSCAVGSTWPSGGRRSTHSCAPSEIAYVRFERPPAISVRGQRRVVAPVDVVGEVRAQTVEIDAVDGPHAPGA